MKYYHAIDRGGAAATGGRNSGVALFIAISLLALFSALGASYVRYMSLELDETDMRLRGMRARHYAAAGVYSVSGNIRDALSRGALPLDSHTFSYGLYGDLQGGPKDAPASLDTYNAQARVTVAAMNEDDWNERFSNGPAWPGEKQAFHVISRAQVQRAGPGRMITLAQYAVEAVLIAQSECCDIIYWSVYKDGRQPE